MCGAHSQGGGSLALLLRRPVRACMTICRLGAPRLCGHCRSILTAKNKKFPLHCRQLVSLAGQEDSQAWLSSAELGSRGAELQNKPSTLNLMATFSARARAPNDGDTRQTSRRRRRRPTLSITTSSRLCLDAQRLSYKLLYFATPSGPRLQNPSACVFARPMCVWARARWI